MKVKWGKELYPDIELNTGEPPMVFKAQLFALTGVQPHRQKIMLKGATIKEDSWDGLKIKDVSNLYPPNPIVHNIKLCLMSYLVIFQ